MKGFDPTAGHPFEPPFIEYHLQRAKVGNYESAVWIRNNAQRAVAEGTPVEPHVCLAVAKMRRGGLRRSIQKQGQRGKRGPGLGDHRQLLLAREMWKQIELGGLGPIAAAKVLNKGERSALAAYYRYLKLPHRRVLDAELDRDRRDDPEGWAALLRRQGAISQRVQLEHVSFLLE